MIRLAFLVVAGLASSGNWLTASDYCDAAIDFAQETNQEHLEEKMAARRKAREARKIHLAKELQKGNISVDKYMSEMKKVQKQANKDEGCSIL